MLIGEDFEKITIDLFGATLLEPNTFIGDVLIFVAAIFFTTKVVKLKLNGSFFRYWIAFYIVFGVGFLFGGFAHLLYNYWGIAGKYAPWCIAIVASLMLELAMITVHPSIKTKKLLRLLAFIKFICAILFATYFYLTVDVSENPLLGLIIPLINSTIGLVFCLIYLGAYYQSQIDKSFKYFWVSGLTLVPSALFQLMKINIHPYLDRNDISHALLILSMFLYYRGITGYNRYLDQTASE